MLNIACKLNIHTCICIIQFYSKHEYTHRTWKESDLKWTWWIAFSAKCSWNTKNFIKSNNSLQLLSVVVVGVIVKCFHLLYMLREIGFSSRYNMNVYRKEGKNNIEIKMFIYTHINISHIDLC